MQGQACSAVAAAAVPSPALCTVGTGGQATWEDAGSLGPPPPGGSHFAVNRRPLAVGKPSGVPSWLEISNQTLWMQL